MNRLRWMYHRSCDDVCFRSCMTSWWQLEHFRRCFPPLRVQSGPLTGIVSFCEELRAVVNAGTSALTDDS